jgi:O-antigen/teichoic acid export membrane protein
LNWNELMRSKGAGQVLWHGLASATPRAVFLLTTLFVARRYGPDNFARITLVLTTIMVAGNLPGTTLTLVGGRFLPEIGHLSERAGVARSNALVLLGAATATISSLILFFWADAINRFLATEVPDSWFRWAALSAAILIIQGTAAAFHVGSAQFVSLARANIAGFVAFAVLIFPLATLAGPAGALMAFSAFYLVSAFWCIATARDLTSRRTHVTFSSETRKEFFRMGRFLLPSMIATGLVTPVAWICNAILAHQKGGLSEITIFAAAYNFYAVVVFVPSVLAQVQLVRLVRVRATSGATALANQYRRFGQHVLAAVVPIVLVGAVMADFLMGIFHAEHGSGPFVLTLMLLSALIWSISASACVLLTMLDRMWVISITNAIWAVTAVVMTYVLRSWGASGAAVGFVCGFVLQTLWLVWIARKLLHRNLIRNRAPPHGHATRDR